MRAPRSVDSRRSRPASGKRRGVSVGPAQSVRRGGRGFWRCGARRRTAGSEGGCGTGAHLKRDSFGARANVTASARRRALASSRGVLLARGGRAERDARLGVGLLGRADGGTDPATRAVVRGATRVASGATNAVGDTAEGHLCARVSAEACDRPASQSSPPRPTSATPPGCLCPFGTFGNPARSRSAAFAGRAKRTGRNEPSILGSGGFHVSVVWGESGGNVTRGALLQEKSSRIFFPRAVPRVLKVTRREARDAREGTSTRDAAAFATVSDSLGEARSTESRSAEPHAASSTSGRPGRVLVSPEAEPGSPRDETFRSIRDAEACRRARRPWPRPRRDAAHVSRRKRQERRPAHERARSPAMSPSGAARRFGARPSVFAPRTRTTPPRRRPPPPPRRPPPTRPTALPSAIPASRARRTSASTSRRRRRTRWTRTATPTFSKPAWTGASGLSLPLDRPGPKRERRHVGVPRDALGEDRRERI